MNDLGYYQLSNLDLSLKLVLMRRVNHQELIVSLADDLNRSHSLSQSPQISRAKGSILTIQSSLRTSYDVYYIIF